MKLFLLFQKFRKYIVAFFVFVLVDMAVSYFVFHSLNAVQALIAGLVFAVVLYFVDKMKK